MLKGIFLEDKHTLKYLNFWRGKQMTKMTNMIEMFKDDLNNDEGMFLSYIDKMLQVKFKFILLAGIPFLLYLLISAQTLG